MNKFLEISLVDMHWRRNPLRLLRYVALSTRYYRKELLEVVSHKRLQELEEPLDEESSCRIISLR